MSRTVVMIHGMWATPHVWRHWRSTFESLGWQVLTPALRHHDAPPLQPPDALGTTSLLDYAADLEAWIAGLPAKPAIIGHSMGGLLAQILAARGSCTAAVLLCPAPPAGIVALHPSVIRAFLRIEMRWGWWKQPHRASLAEALYGTFNTCTNRPECLREHEQFVHDSGRVLLEIGLPFLDRRRAASVDPKAIACPVLVIGAEKDRLTPASVVRKVAQRYAHVAEHREFADQGHWVLGQPGWRYVAAYTAEWIERIRRAQAQQAAGAERRQA
jgi:pimeloyl-ACP methyl ester carboxylesterase